MTTIYLVRHAEASGNIERRFQGHFDGVVTPTGEKPLAYLSERFKGIHLDAVYSSPLSRARQTAQAVDAYAQLPIHTDPRLMEINGGEFEGQFFDDLPKLFPVEFNQWATDPVHFRAPGGESMLHVYERMRTVIEEIVCNHPNQTVAVVSHGCAIRNYLCYAQGWPLEEIKYVPWGENTCVSRIDYDEQVCPHVVFLNDAGHLPPDQSCFKQQSWWKKVPKRPEQQPAGGKTI